MPEAKIGMARQPVHESHRQSASSLVSREVSVRDVRLDVFRGLALVMIFLNHVPGNFYEDFTNRNFGFSDAAEAFVLMSGMAAGLAYVGKFETLSLWRATMRVWGRAWTLYYTHIAITTIAIGICAGAALFFGASKMIEINNLAPLFRQPLQVLVGIPTLGHQLGYINILPVYAALLLATPFFITLGRWSPKALLAVSVAIWSAAGQFRLNFPAYPNAGGWFFNPLSWQLIFVIGLLTGMALKDDRRFVPKKRALVWISGLFLLFVVVWMKWPLVAEAGRGVLSDLRKAGLPFYITNFDKTFLAVPRLIHILALAYFLSTLGWVRTAANSRWMAPLALMGRFGLPVFATGTVLSIFLQSVKASIEAGFLLDTGLLAAGLFAQYMVAHVRDVLSRKS